MKKKRVLIKILGNMCINNNKINIKELNDFVVVDNCIALCETDSTYRVNKLILNEDITIKGNLYVDDLKIHAGCKVEIQCAGSIYYYSKDEYNKECNNIPVYTDN